MPGFVWKKLSFFGGTGPIKNKTLLFYGDSITTMGLYRQAYIYVEGCATDGEHLTIRTDRPGTPLRHGLVVGDTVRICGLNPEISNAYRVSEVINDFSYKVPSTFKGAIASSSVGSPGSMRIESATYGYGNLANWACGNKADMTGAVAIWGARLPDFVSRFQHDVLSFSPRPDYIHVLGGTNDMTQLRQVADCIADYESMYQAAAAAGIKCIWGCIPARLNLEAVDEQAQALSLELVEATKTWCKGHGIPCVDYMEVTRNPATGFMYEDMSYIDAPRLHFGPYGNWCMATQGLAPVLEREFAAENPLPKTVEDCGLIANPMFEKTSTYNTAKISGQYPTGHALYISGSATTKIATSLEPGEFGKIWKLALTSMGPNNYGAVIYLKPGLTPFAVPADGYIQFKAKIKTLNMSDRKMKIDINIQLLRNGVANPYTYGTLDFGDISQATDFEIDYVSLPIFVKKGDAITLAENNSFTITPRNASTTVPEMSMDIEVSQADIHFTPSSYFPTR